MVNRERIKVKTEIRDGSSYIKTGVIKIFSNLVKVNFRL